MKHMVHRFNIRSIPTTDVLIKRFSVSKHVLHIRDVRCIPIANISVKVANPIKQIIHVDNLRRINIVLRITKGISNPFMFNRVSAIMRRIMELLLSDSQVLGFRLRIIKPSRRPLRLIQKGGKVVWWL